MPVRNGREFKTLNCDLYLDTDEDILEWLENKPKGYITKVALRELMEKDNITVPPQVKKKVIKDDEDLKNLLDE